jgi:hypothetical protein
MLIVEVIIFSSVRFLSKKSNQTSFFSKKTETGRFGSVILEQKPFFFVWLGFSVLLNCFPILLGYFALLA